MSNSNKGTATLTVTANGRADLFFRVDQLIKEAPVIPGWQFQALIPPTTPDHRLVDRYGDWGIDVNALWCRIVDPPFPGWPAVVEVYAEIYDPHNHNHRLLLETAVGNVLGERAKTQYVREVQIKWLFAVPPELRPALRKLLELPALFLERTQKHIQTIGHPAIVQ